MVSQSRFRLELGLDQDHLRDRVQLGCDRVEQSGIGRYSRRAGS
jgi:hypothetical protein